MHSLSWSHQKPEKRAVERDEEAIEQWKRKDWPRVKKTLRGWAPISSSRTIRVPADPDVVKTWARAARLPCIAIATDGTRSPSSRESRQPKRQRLGLFYQLYFNNIGHEEVCIFLRDLLRHLRGPVIALLDNSTTHMANRWQNSSASIPVSISNTSPPTRRNSIRTRGSGHRPSGT